VTIADNDVNGRPVGSPLGELVGLSAFVGKPIAEATIGGNSIRFVRIPSSPVQIGVDFGKNMADVRVKDSVVEGFFADYATPHAPLLQGRRRSLRERSNGIR
jgi:hypothetical protein